MFFRFWFYSCKLAGPLFALLFLGMLLGHQNSIVRILGQVAILAIIFLSAIGAALVIPVYLYGMRFRCPFCAEPGHLGGNRSIGLWLDCPHCGCVRGKNHWSWQLAREFDDHQAP